MSCKSGAAKNFRTSSRVKIGPQIRHLNPLNFSVWSVVESGACPIRHQNSESLKAAITKAWQEMDTDYQRMICDAFMKRLRELKRFSVRLNVPI
ncbi:hypothetical protein Y032_0117g696 [Ancylostoma ceylanicum]|uniref:Uncharacterized protein n=1 Tax=Ancylostoma ceylanicum TaxID=53326 RepID=A0A016TC71_9BILA|nr:hypothetical protein Y032_0117g696 [Ancylostoma ceylanicum]